MVLVGKIYDPIFEEIKIIDIDEEFIEYLKNKEI
jgi:hypothetical protein